MKYIGLLIIFAQIFFKGNSQSPIAANATYKGMLIVTGTADKATKEMPVFEYHTFASVAVHDSGYIISWKAVPGNLLASISNTEELPAIEYLLVSTKQRRVYDLSNELQYSIIPRKLFSKSDSSIIIDGVACREFTDPAEPDSRFFCASNLSALTLLGFYSPEAGFCIKRVLRPMLVLNSSKVTDSMLIPKISKSEIGLFPKAEPRQIL